MGTAIDYVLEFLLRCSACLRSSFAPFAACFCLCSFRRLLVLLHFLIPLSFSSRGGTNWGGILLLILIFPVIGSFAVSRLKYLQYMVTEFFYERADYYLLGKDITYETMGDYGRRYQRKIEEERRRQEEARARMEEELFRQRFEAFFNQANSYGGDYGSYNEGSYNQGGYQGAYDGGFKEKYEAAIERLGVDVNADKYEIRLAYKKLAKSTTRI